MRLTLIFALVCLLSVNVVLSQNIDCPDALPSRLVIGQKGLMIQNQPSDLYTEPGGQIIENIPANSVFDVLDGPVCNENFAWWHVRYADQDGWAVEGEAGIYFLEPLTPITTANLQQLDDVQLLGRGVFTTGLEWSSDGAKIAVGSTVGVVQFDTEDFSAPSFWYNPSTSGQVCDVEYSDDGSGRWGFAICAEGSNTEIRTIDENPYAERWYSFDGEIHEFKFINYRDSLVIATQNKIMLLEGGVGSQDLLWEGENRIVALDVSANGIAFAATDGKQVVLGTPFSRLATTLLDVGDVFAVTSLALNFDGTLLAIGVNRQIQLWDVETQTMLAVHDNLGGVDGAAVQALDMKFSTNGERLVTTTSGCTLTVWVVGESELEQTDTINLEGFGPMTHLALKPDGTQAAMILLDGRNNTLFMRPIDVTQHLVTFTNGHTQPIRDIAFSPDSQTLVSVGEDNEVYVWDVVSGKDRLPLIGRDPSAGFTQDGSLLTISSSLNDNSTWWFHQWDAQFENPQTRQHVAFFDAISDSVFSPDARWIASDIRISDNHSTAIWDVNRLRDGDRSAMTQPDYLLRYEAVRSSKVFSPDSRWFAYSDLDEQKNGTVTLLDATTFAPVHTLNGHTNPIWDVAFSPDSKLLVSVSGTSGPGLLYLMPDDNTARVWDVETGDEKFVLPHISSVSSVAFHPDGTFFVTGTVNGDMNFWDAATGEKLHTIQSPYGGVNALAFSPDGVWFAASTGSVVKIYRIPMFNTFGEG